MKRSCSVSIPFPFYTPPPSQCLLLESPTSWQRFKLFDNWVIHMPHQINEYPFSHCKPKRSLPISQVCSTFYVIPFNILHFEIFTDQNFWKIVENVILFLWVTFLTPFRSPEWVSSLCKTPNHSLIPLNYFKDVSVQKRIILKILNCASTPLVTSIQFTLYLRALLGHKGFQWLV